MDKLQHIVVIYTSFSTVSNVCEPPSPYGNWVVTRIDFVANFCYDSKLR